jgi:hypothetical protein
LKFKIHGSSNFEDIQQKAWTSDLQTAGAGTLIHSALCPETNVQFICSLRSQIDVPCCCICVLFVSSVHCFSGFESPFDYSGLNLINEDGDKIFCQNGFLLYDFHSLRSRRLVNMNFYYSLYTAVRVSSVTVVTVRN